MTPKQARTYALHRQAVQNAGAGFDWAHQPALGTTCRTTLDGRTTADACAWCGRPLTLDPTDDNRATQWHVAADTDTTGD